MAKKITKKVTSHVLTRRIPTAELRRRHRNKIRRTGTLQG